MSQNLPTFSDSTNKIVEVMRGFYELPEGFNGDEKEFFYKKALENHPELNLPNYEDTQNIQDEYASNPDDIDYSPESVNFQYNAMNKIKDEMLQYLSNKQPAEIRGVPQKSLTEGIESLQENINYRWDKVGENQYKKVAKTGSIFEGLVNPESWMHIEKYEGLKESVKVGLNNTVPGLMYQIKHGKDLYDVDMDKYDPSFSESVMEGITSFSDPMTILSFYGGYGAVSKGAEYTFKGIGKSVPVLKKWIQQATGKHVIKNIPKTNTSKTFLQKLPKYLDNYGARMFESGVGLGGTMGIFGALHSSAEQRTNKGKYKTNDGTINYWDVLSDGWHSTKEGFTIGAITKGVNLVPGVYNMWGKANWKMGVKNWRTWSAKNLLGTPTQLGTAGTIMTTVPMALNEDVRDMYYDEEGNFKKGLFARNTLLASGTLFWMWGIDNASFSKTQFKHRKSPNWHTKPNTTHKGFALPENVNFATELSKISRDLKLDIKYETNKSLDLELGSSEDKMLSQSLKNVANELGPEAGVDFFDKDITNKTESVETVQGLKTINEVVNQTFEILNRTGIKNDKGEFIGVKVDKLTDGDVQFLTYVTPSVISGYQGYRLKYFETDSGKQEYIERYEKEFNNGNKLDEQQRNIVLKQLEMRIDRFDIIKSDFNSRALEGLSKSEQIVPENKSEINQDKVEVIALNDDGKPVDNKILLINKEEANKGIEENQLQLAKDAENKGIETIDVVSENYGTLTPEQLAIVQAVKVGIKEGLAPMQEQTKLKEEYSPYTRMTVGEVLGDGTPQNPGLLSTVDSNTLLNRARDIRGEGMTQKAENFTDTNISWIKDKFDILSVNSLTNDEIVKWMPTIKKLHAHTNRTGRKKKKLLETTQTDVEAWINHILKERADAKVKTLGTNENVALRNFWATMKDKDYIKTNPSPKGIVSEQSTAFYAERGRPKVGEELPAMPVWFEKASSDKITENIKGIDKLSSLDKKRLEIGATLFDRYTLRDLELNALTGREIKPYKNYWYIDLTRGRRGKLGAAKEKGEKRPLWIPKELAFELQSIAGGTPSKRLFQIGSKTLSSQITPALKQTVGDNNITAKAYQRQMVDFGLSDKVGLTDVEKSMLNFMQGHAVKTEDMTPSDKKIVKLYKNRKNWEEMFEIQKNVLLKISNAREGLIKSGSTMFIEKIKAGLERPGLSIKEIEGKSDKEIIEKSKESLNETPILNDAVRAKLASAVNRQWNLLTQKMSPSEKREFLEYIASNAGIINYKEFGSRSGNITSKDLAEEIAMFSDEIIDTKSVKVLKSKENRKKIENLIAAKRIMEDNDFGVEAQKKMLQSFFFPEKSLELINDKDLSYEQSKQFLDYVLSDKNNFPDKTSSDFVMSSINSETFSQLSNQLGFMKGGNWKSAKGIKEKLAPIWTLNYGGYGRIQTTFPWLAKKLNRPEIKKMGEDLINHAVIEHAREGGRFSGMEVDIYKAIFKDAVDKGKTTFLPTQPHTSFLRRGKNLYMYGKKIFDKEIKDNMAIVLDINTKGEPYRYRWLQNQVLNNPDDKHSKKILKQAKNFHDKVWDNNGKIRKNTVEGKIAKIYYKWDNTNWKRIEDAIKMNMTDANWVSYKKKNSLKKIKLHVPRMHRDDFLKQIDFRGSKFEREFALEREIEIDNLIKEKYGDKKLTDKQQLEIESIAEVNVSKNFAAIQQYGARGFHVKNLSRRGVYFGETRLIKGKWTPVYETRYDKWASSYASSLNKGIANIEIFPYLTEIPGIKFNQIYPKALIEAKDSGGIVGDYIASMIQGRTGLTAKSPYVKIPNTLKMINVYATRTQLTRLKSPIKNFMLAQGMNFLQHDAIIVARAMTRAIDFAHRMEARQTGMMQISFSAITANEIKFVSKLIDKMFQTARFPSSEEMGRLTAIYSTLLELPFLYDAALSRSKKTLNDAITILKNVYELSDTPIAISKNLTIKGGEIELFQRYGLGEAEVDWKGKGSIDEKGTKAKRFKKVEDLDMSSGDRARVQKRLDTIHSKFLMMAHEKTSGSTIEIFQPKVFQDPFINPLAVYAKLATAQTYNMLNILKTNKKTGRWNQTIIGTAWGVGATPALLYAIDRLLNKTDEGMLDTTWYKKIFRTLERAEYGGVLAFTWGLANWKMPLSNPVLPMMPVDVIMGEDGILQQLADIVALGLEKSGIDPKGKGDFAELFVRKYRYKQAPVAFAKKMSGAFAEFIDAKQKRNHPYYKKQKDIDSWERKFYNEIKPLGRPSIINTTVMSPHYKEIQNQFMKSDNWDDLNQTVISTWRQLFEIYKDQPNITYEEAGKRATQSIDRKFATLHPVLNGQGSNSKGKFFSDRVSFMLFLKDKAIKQKKSNEEAFTNEEKAIFISGASPRSYKERKIFESANKKLTNSFYVKELIKQEIIYEARLEAFYKQFTPWLQKNKELRKEEYLKFWKKVVKTDKNGNVILPNLERLGLLIE